MAKNFNYDEVPVVETTGGRLKGFLYEGAYIAFSLKSDALHFSA